MASSDVDPTIPATGDLEQCLRALVAHLDPASSTRICVVEGPPGCGRTTVVRRAAEELAGRRCRTELLGCSDSSRAVPFAPFAPFIGDTDATDAAGEAPVRLLRSLHDALAPEGDRRTVLLIDDAQHLDGSSFVLLNQLLWLGGTAAVLAADSTAPWPDDLLTITSTHPTDWLHAGPVDRDGSDRLVELFSDGCADPERLERIWQLARGVPAYTAELASAPSGDMARQLPAQLVVAVQRRLERAGAGHGLFTALTLQDRLPEDACVAVVGPEVLRAAIRSGLVVRRSSGGATVVEPAFGLVTAVAGLHVSSAERREVAARLLEGLERTGSASESVDGLIAHAELLDAAGREDPVVFEAAADASLRRHDAARALRFADAAVRAGAGPNAQLIKACALSLAGRFDAATDVVEDVLATADPDVAVRALRRWALATLFDRADPDGAARVLDLAAQRDPVAGVALRRAQMPNVRFYAGSSSAALRSFEELDAAGITTPFDALPGALGACVAQGRPDRCLELLEGETTWNWDHTMTAISLVWVRLLALWQVGRLGEVGSPTDGLGDVECETLVDSMLLRRVMPASLSLFRGQLADPASAGLDAAALSSHAPPQVAAFTLALDGLRLALLGRTLEARGTVGRIDDLPKSAASGFAWWVERVEVICLAAEGRRAEAATAALRLAADHSDEPFHRVTSLHDAAVFGAHRTVLDELVELAAHHDSTWWARTCARHVEALADGEVAALVDAAERFERGGLLLCAMYANDDAARAGARPGSSTPGRIVGERARQEARRLRSVCGDLATLAVDDHLSALTEREYTVAVLAARGLRNSVIAEHLGTSVRTVGNQLQRVYQKLGLHSRAELSPLVEPWDHVD